MQFLKKRLPEVLEYTHGLLIITHSEIVVNELKEIATFLNMDSDMTADEWINREIIPTDFEELDKNSYGLYQAINARSKKNK